MYEQSLKVIADTKCIYLILLINLHVIYAVITAKFCTATGDKKREDGWPILSPHSFYILVVKFTIIPVFAVPCI